ncbi:uncharacterized protein PG998_009401 [Apiospora kogelbergensis]|uniref:uncharacterized protein n=1 Tax=Apiospora kogelbergensis TaxID=1337665 RepID=UPI003131C533
MLLTPFLQLDPHQDPSSLGGLHRYRGVHAEPRFLPARSITINKGFVDFIRMLYARASNLNSTQILERCRANFGRYPPMQVQDWLHKSVGEHQRAREAIGWRRGDRQFKHNRDLINHLMALDAIFASTFGLPEAEGMTIQRLKAVLGHSARLAVSADQDEPVKFPEGVIPTIFAAVLTIQDSATITQMSPAPVFASCVLRKLPKMKKAIAIKDQYIRDQVAQSVELIE